MAVPDPTVLEDVSHQLHVLTQRALAIKPSNSIEPSLPVSEFSGVNGLPVKDGGYKAHAVAIEVAARRIFQILVGREDIESPGFGQIWNLLDILQILGDQEQCEPILVWYLIEELLESQNIEGCRVVFDYLESRRERLAKHFEKVQLAILRSCNDLLRRLSRADDAVFCGRVFIFVFQCFPLGDKSSVNRVGDYNVDNVTMFGELASQLTATGETATPMDTDAMDTSNDPPKETDESGNIQSEEPNSLDTDTLYPIFWKMQTSFAHPPAVVKSPKDFSDFKHSLEATLAKFKATSKMISSNSLDRKKEPKRDFDKVDTVEKEELITGINPKYLTSRELFDLELNDLAFQRHILVQAMILVEFLLSYNTSKKKPAPATGSQEEWKLPETEMEWVTQIKKAIGFALRDAPDGPAFTRVVETVISRDRNWLRWKDDNCPLISRNPVEGDLFQNAKASIQSEYAQKFIRANPMDSLDLTFLKDEEKVGGIEQLLTLPEFIIPSTQILVKRVDEVELDLDMAMDEEETNKLQDAKQTKIWRTLRTAGRTKLSMFDKVNDGKNLGCLIDRGAEPITEGDDTHDVEGADNDGIRPSDDNDSGSVGNIQATTLTNPG